MDSVRIAGRRWMVAAALPLILLPACQRARPKPLASSVKTADPAVAHQLAAGFYGVESNAWRWTGKDFSVVLLPPQGADRRGARLQVRLFIPDRQIQQIGAMTLNADVDGHDLPSQTFTRGGAQVYTSDVPADALRSNAVPVNFSFDKAAPPAGGDARELGAVVSEIALVSR